VVSPSAGAAPWPTDRDIVLEVNVTAESAKLCVINYQPEKAIAPSPVHIEKMP
jgi:hypothetical protein